MLDECAEKEAAEASPVKDRNLLHVKGPIPRRQFPVMLVGHSLIAGSCLREGSSCFMPDLLHTLEVLLD